MILLTGATGVLGSAIGSRLRHDDLICMSRQPRRAPGVSLVADVRQKQLGLSGAQYRAICAQVTTVVHSAAVVSMMAHPSEYEDVNVRGTEHIIAFARDAGARLIHISTAFVGTESINTTSDSGTYEGSKRAAEALVRTAGIDATIVRPSIIAGDSVSGIISREQGLHQMAAGLVEGPVRVIPGDQNTLVDFVPADYVANAAIGVIGDGCAPDELWVTSGAAALSVEAVARLVNDFMAVKNVPGEVRTLASDAIERLFVPAFLPELPPHIRARVRLLLQLMRHLNRRAPFPTSADYIRDTYGLPLPDPTVVLERNLNAWWLRTRPTVATGARSCIA
jgi:nucleoside-diphosphate-sugar epimerase